MWPHGTTHLKFLKHGEIFNNLICTLLDSVQRVCSAAEEATWLQDGRLQAGGETAAGRDGQDEGILGRNSKCKSREK